VIQWRGLPDQIQRCDDRVLVLLMPEQFEPWPQGKADATALHPAANDYSQR
jgi:hypothetical protein